MTTNVPQITFGNNGVVIPSQQAVLEGVVADFLAAFGSGLNLDASDPSTLATPQGQLATSMAAVIYNTYQMILYQSTQTDPSFAQGRWQDAIASIYFLSRNPAEPTVVQATCSGLAGTVLPEGSLAIATDGSIFASNVAATIGVGGTVSVAFSCTVPGPTACPAGSLNQIYQSVTGWDSITNPTDGVLGNDVESRSELEARRIASVAANSMGALPAILGAVLEVEGVLDAYATENDSDAPVTIGGYTLEPNSLYVAVVGGDADEVAQAIWSRKAPGCSYNGNTTVTVYDDSPVYSPPLPSYEVKFETPASLPVIFAVNLQNGPQVPADAAELVQEAIVNAFSGDDGGPRARIGSKVYASRFYAPVAAIGSWVRIISILLGSSNDSDAASFAGTISGTALTVTVVLAGTIATGQTVVGPGVEPGTTITAGGGLSWTLSQANTVAGASFTGTGSGTDLTVTGVTGTIEVDDVLVGTGVPLGTTIVSQTSGTPGGAGVYVTSIATTSSGASITASPNLYGVDPDQNDVTVDIDQVPTIDASNVAVTLS